MLLINPPISMTFNQGQASEYPQNKPMPFILQALIFWEGFVMQRFLEFGFIVAGFVTGIAAVYLRWNGLIERMDFFIYLIFSMQCYLAARPHHD